MIQPEEITLHSRGLRLQAKRWGTQGIPTLAVPGWLDNANSFDRLVPHLPGLQVVAVDLPGHGRSDFLSADAQYHFVDWVGHMIAVVDSLGWQRFVLMGHSMGAGVGTLLAGAFVDRVEALVLLDGLGPHSGEADAMPLRLVAQIREQNRLAARSLATYPSQEAAATLLSKVVPGLSVAGARILVERGTKPVPGGWAWSSDPRLRGTSIMRLTEAQVLAFLRCIRAPTLLLRARQGYPFDAEQMEARLAAIAGARRVDIDGGHHVHLEDPVATAAVVMPFLREVATGW